jgi:hypothetical protein
MEDAPVAAITETVARSMRPASATGIRSAKKGSGRRERLRARFGRERADIGRAPCGRRLRETEKRTIPKMVPLRLAMRI